MPDKQSNAGSAGASASGCVDQDGDGFGDNCSAGQDCNDFNATVTNQCFSACSDPSKGCDCNGDAPVPCFLDQSANPDGTIMCHEGTRYCRNGTWGACEDVHSYSVVPRQENKLLPDVLPRRTCSDCEQNCFVAQDYLEYVGGGLGPYANSEVEQIPAGGLTIRRTSDAGVLMVDAGPDMYPDGAVQEWPLPDAGPCVVGDPLDSDCDNIPNYYDPSPTNPAQPFAAPPDTIVSTTPSNVAVDVDIDNFEFRLTEADVYFMLDVTRNQNVERQAFIDAVNDIGVAAAPNLVDRVVTARTGSSAYNCIDADGDGSPDDFRKNEGFVGAMRCFVGDAYMGLGFMDEVPVRDSCSLSYGGITILGTTYGATTWTECHYGDNDSATAPNNAFARVPFRSLFDLSANDVAFKGAAWRLPVIPTRLEIPQSGAQALWALSNGEAGDLYYGSERPAFGARRDCPAGTYGASCFRSGVLPITFMFTDTGQHNGPNNYIPVGYRPGLTTTSSPTSSGAPYVANNLAFPSGTWGTPHAGGERARHLPQTNETFFAPLDLGTITNERLTFTGSTIGMTSDATAASMGACGAVNGTPDAFMAFNIAANGTPVTISTAQTPWDSNGSSTQTPTNFAKVVSLFPNVTATSTTAIGMTHNAGAINGTIQRFTGNTSTLLTGALGNVSRCGADGTTGEAVITFTAAAGTVLAGDISGGGQAVMDIYRTAPLTNPVPVVLPNTNDTFATAHNINATSTPTSPGYQTFTGSTTALPFDYLASTVSCGPAANGANDAVFQFTVGGPTTVKIDTEGSAINTVISLHDAPPISPNTLTVNDSQADSVSGWNMGAADNAITTLEGTTAGPPVATAQFLGNSVASCLGADSDADHLIPFTLTGATSVTVRELNTGTGINPPVAIYSSVAPSTGTIVNNDSAFAPATGVSAATAYDLATIGGIANRRIQLNALTTTGKGEQHTTDMFAACGSSPPLAGANDVVYRFNSPVAISNATFRVESNDGSRPMMALFTSQPNEYVDVRGVANNNHGSAYAVTLSTSGVQTLLGSTSGKVSDYSQYGVGYNVQCATGSGSLDAIYRITNPISQSISFRAESITGGHDPILRLFPQTAGVPVAPWVNVAPAATEGITVAVPLDVSGGIARVTGTFGSGIAASDNADFDCAGIDNASRDTFVQFRLTRPTKLWMRVTADNDTEPALMVFPKDGNPYNGVVHAKATNLETGSAVSCIGATGSTTQSYNTITLAAGDYYAVIKAMRRNASACAVCLCLCSGTNYYQDGNFTLDLVDVSDGTFGTTNQVQLSCDDDSGSPPADAARLNYTNLPAGTYDVVVTSQTATPGDHRLVFGPASATMPSASQCSAPVAATSMTTISRSAAQANTLANAAASPLPTMTNAWIQVDSDLGSGTWNDNADLCGADNNSRDAFYQFTLTRTSTIQVDAWGDSDTGAGLTILRSTAGSPALLTDRAVDTSAATVACSSASSGTRTMTVTLAAGTYYAAIKAHDNDGNNCSCLCIPGCAANWLQDDGIHLRIRDLTESTAQSMTVPTINAGQDYYVVVKGQNATAGSYNMTIGGAVTPTMCLAANAVGTAAMPIGTHYALIKGGATGDYDLQLGESAATSDNRIACDDDSGPTVSSSLTYALPAAGTYYVVVKGKTAADQGNYRLNIRDLSSPTDTWQACGAASGTNSFTSAPLAGGTYQAVIKGSDGVGGAFTAQLYDAATAPVAASCSNGASISTTLNAGRHVIGIKGAAAGTTGAGAYQVSIAAGAVPVATPAQRAFASKTWASTRSAVLARGMKVVPMQSCEPGTDWGTGSGDPNNGGTSGAFNACGDNYSGPLAFVLGIIAAAITWIPFVGCLLFDIIAIVFALIGLVQINSPVTAVQNNPVSCDTANPDALYASVQNPSGQNPPRGAWPQSKEIARTTDTVNTAGTPIAYWLRRNPTSDTVAFDVADALYQLATEIRMDVSINMVWDSSTTPGYVVNATAVTPTQCASAAGATHRDCSPGDRPEFQVSFLNPSLNPVAQNPDAGWNGAWPGRLVILGDGQFVLEEIPVLLIPPLTAPMGPPMPPPRYTGIPAVYYQDIGTRECVGNNQPDWTDLFFNAEMPPGTRIVFEACAEDMPGALNTCTAQTVATLTATNTPCFNDSQCRGINGFCGNGGPDYPGGYCQVITPQKHKGLCSSESECPDGPENGITPYDLLSDCVSSECEYDSQPADMGAALGATNFRRNSRMRITMYPDPTLAFAPNLLDWAVTYICTPNQ